MLFVYAHHKHRQRSENPGNFGDCMKGRIRFMTAITPAYAHAYQTFCLTMHFLVVRTTLSGFTSISPSVHIFPMVVSITRELGNDYHGWAIYTDGGTRVVDGEPLAGWGF